MVQINGSQPPEDEQKVATEGWLLTLPSLAKA
jgi:hypothetical protein